MTINYPKIFIGKEVNVIGTGASLIDFDFTFFDKKNVIAVNDAYRFVKSDCLVAVDVDWYKRDYNNNLFKKYKKPIFTSNEIEGTIRIKLDPNNSFDYGIINANISGFTAIAVADYLGAKSINLYGMDFNYEGGKYFFDNPYGNRGSFNKAINMFHVFNKLKITNYNFRSKLPIPQKWIK